MRVTIVAMTALLCGAYAQQDRQAAPVSSEVSEAKHRFESTCGVSGRCRRRRRLRLASPGPGPLILLSK